MSATHARARAASSPRVAFGLGVLGAMTASERLEILTLLSSECTDDEGTVHPPVLTPEEFRALLEMPDAALERVLEGPSFEKVR